MSSSDENKAAVRGFFDVAMDGDYDRLDAVIGPDYVCHNPDLPEDVRGIEGAREMVEMYRNGIGGLRVTIDHQFTEGDYVATRFTVRGRHEGHILGVPATGTDVTCTGITISRCREGKVVEEWEVSDVFGLLRQIGALPELVQS